MATCIRCGNKGFFLKVDKNGRCASCSSAYEKERKADEEKNKYKPDKPKASIFDLKRPGETLRYKYKDVKLSCSVIYPPSILRLGQVCGFIRSETSPDLIDVVYILNDDFVTLGFIPDGKLSNMVADWIDRDWTAWGQVVEITSDDIYLDIAFWIPDGER